MELLGPQRGQWVLLVPFLCASSTKPNNLRSNLRDRLSSCESAEAVTDSLSSLRQDLLKPKLMPEMHGSSVWTPLVTASGCPVALRSLWKQSVSLNKNSALRNVQRSRALILRCERPLWQTCHYKRDIKHHRGTICSLARWSCTQYCTSYGNGIVCRVDHGRPVISSFGADVVWPLWV